MHILSGAESSKHRSQCKTPASRNKHARGGHGFSIILSLSRAWQVGLDGCQVARTQMPEVSSDLALSLETCRPDCGINSSSAFFRHALNSTRSVHRSTLVWLKVCGIKSATQRRSNLGGWGRCPWGLNVTGRICWIGEGPLNLWPRGPVSPFGGKRVERCDLSAISENVSAWFNLSVLLQDSSGSCHPRECVGWLVHCVRWLLWHSLHLTGISNRL